MGKDEIRRGTETLVHICANVKANEKVLIISDTITYELGKEIELVAKTISSYVKHLIIEPFKIHGQEPPSNIANEMLGKDIIFGITKMSLAHSLARQKASLNGARYLSLPDYSIEMLSSEALQVDYNQIASIVEKVSEVLTKGNKVVVKTELGTDIISIITNRKGNAAPGRCLVPGTLSSPPDIEANIAPIEDQSEGVIVVDGSIPCNGLGILEEPIQLEIRKGSITKVSGKKSIVIVDILDELKDLKTHVLAEIGFGLNPKAKLQGFMLEDEGCIGTVHFGFGSNTALGGLNQIPFHLDMVIRFPTVYVDDKMILEKGRLLL